MVSLEDQRETHRPFIPAIGHRPPPPLTFDASVYARCDEGWRASRTIGLDRTSALRGAEEHRGGAMASVGQVVWNPSRPRERGWAPFVEIWLGQSVSAATALRSHARFGIATR